MKIPQSIQGCVRGLHHVAIAVPSIEEARRIYVDVLGLRAGAIEHVAEQKVDVLICQAGGQRIELLQPASPDSPISRFIEKRGGGLHHLAYLVDDLDQALLRLETEGVKLIDHAPRPGAHGTRIAFLHPRATGGVLTELVEEPKHSSGAVQSHSATTDQIPNGPDHERESQG